MSQDTYISLNDLCETSGARPTQVEHWCRLGILVPAREATGRGFTHGRGFDRENIIEAKQLAELTKAGLTSRQLQRLAAVQRAALSSLSPPARVVTRYRSYVHTIVQVATIFGQAPGYDEWLKTHTRLLKRIEKILTEGDGADHAIDTRLLRLLSPRPENAGADVRPI